MSMLGFILLKQYKVLAYLPEAVLIIDETGKILYANKSAQKLFETVKIRHKNINDYFLTDIKEIIKASNENIKQIIKLITSEKNTKIADVKITPDFENKNRYIITIADNTSEHLQFNKLLEEKQNQEFINDKKNLLLSKMDNCLTSPIHSILGFSQAMLTGLSGSLNDKQQKYLEIINNNANELLLFMQKLIQLSQIESDIYKFNPQNFDITSLLSIVLNELKLKIKDINITVDTSDLLTTNCYSDKNAIKTVFENLLTNALENIETGSINIRLSTPLTDVLLSKGFEVNGIVGEKSYINCEITCKGIYEKQYNDESIFNPYIQVDKNSKKYLLQSLLLGGAQKLINKLKGNIRVNNEQPNIVVFEFTIPADKLLFEG